jgi:hypothetical protein
VETVLPISLGTKIKVQPAEQYPRRIKPFWTLKSKIVMLSSTKLCLGNLNSCYCLVAIVNWWNATHFINLFWETKTLTNSSQNEEPTYSDF